MSDQLIISQGELPDEDIYLQLLPQIKALVDSNVPVITSLANISAALKQSFEKISWVGFYIMKDGILWLGPFQGKIACTSIKNGYGVCGTVAQTGKPLIVPDVEKFAGHITCDEGSRSEIVIPLFRGKEVYGVLDLDSYFFNAFNETDLKFLQELCRFIDETILQGTKGSIQ